MSVASPNRLILGDNLAVMDGLLRHGSHPDFRDFRLIYADPPFATDGRYRTASGVEVYRDRWPGGLDGYLAWIEPRLARMRDLLAPGGSLVVHLDHRVVHHVKVLLDGLFGRAAFRNEIIWRKSGNRGRRARARQFGRVTESLLWYTRGPGWTFDQPYLQRRIPLGEAAKPAAGVRRDDRGRYFKTAPPGDYTDASLARLDAEGRLHRTSAGRPRVKYFLERRGDHLIERVPVDNLWTDIPDKMHLPRAERLDFPTQKPEVLLERVVASLSRPGDLVGDFFCGSGTTLAVAERLGRRWLGVDIHPYAIEVSESRLRNLATAPFTVERPGDRPRS